MKALSAACVICLLMLAILPDARAESAWVSDEFEITLRSGPSTSNAIQLMVGSGAELEVLERDSESGYTRVRTGGGTEGWVLTRYLMAEPSAREQLQSLTSQLTSASSEGESLNSQLAAVRGEYNSAQREIESLQREKQALEQELAEIKRIAANAISIDDENRALRERLSERDIEVDTLEHENRTLTSQSTRYWFMSGGLVLVVGIALGLWLPRVRWQRRSRYDRF